eukprot:SAG22_NODE_367_length_11613_cov_11.955011_3_plen_148_part_00
MQVYAHGVNDPAVRFRKVLFDHVAVQPGLFEQKLNFSNGVLAIAALGSKLGGHALGGVVFDDVVVKRDRLDARPMLTVVGTRDNGVGGVSGSIVVEGSAAGGGCGGEQPAPGMIVAGAEGWDAAETGAVEAGLRANVSLHCKPALLA